MKPVFQTKYGIGQGNCLTACIASILDVQISDLPEFCDGERAEWFDKLYDYCMHNELFLLHWKHSENVPIIACEAFVVLECKLEGIESENHAVIGRTYRDRVYLLKDGSKRWEWATRIVHDPSEHGHPPIENILSYTLIGKQCLG